MYVAASTEPATNFGAKVNLFGASTRETLAAAVRNAPRDDFLPRPVANPVRGRYEHVGVCGHIAVSPMLPELSRSHHAFRGGDDANTSNTIFSDARVADARQD